MGCGKATLLAFRVLALIAVLGAAGLGGWSMFIIHDIQVRHNAILDNVQFGSQETKQLWTEFFDAVLGGVIRTWVSIGSTAIASLVGIVLVLATILPPIRIRSAIMIPMECLSMCAMGAAVGIALSFALNLDAFGKRNLDVSASPELRRLAMLVDISLTYTVTAGTAWVLFLISFIMAALDACRRAQEKESCSFEPTASALGMAHGYSTTFPAASHSRTPSVYDPQVPLNLNDATASAWNSSHGKESAGQDLGTRRAESIVSDQGRLSFASESSISGPLSLQKPERVQPARPSRPWSEASSIRRAEEGVHAM